MWIWKTQIGKLGVSKEKMISEDELEHGETEIQKLTDKYIADIEETGKNKEKEILEV